MSNRMIKDSMLSSDKIASLSDFEFRLWIGLILSVDDMGRGDARAAIIKGRVFPLQEQVSLRDVEDALHSLAAKGCICLYTVDGRSYFWFPTWSEHQRIRSIKPRYPGPEEGEVRPLRPPPDGSVAGASCATGTHRPGGPAQTPQPPPQAAAASLSGGPQGNSPRHCGSPPSVGEAEGHSPQVSPDGSVVGSVSPEKGTLGPLCGSLRQTAADCGGPPPETKTKSNQTEPQTELKIEPQTETETEDETEPRAREGVSVVDVVVGAVGKLSQKARAELAGFLDSMGEECVVRAVETAQEAGKPTWGYIRGILEHKQDWGVKSAEEWDRQEESRAQWLRRKHESQTIAGTPRDVQPSPQRAKKSADWLEEFLTSHNS